MKTKIFLLSALFTLWLSIGVSQVSDSGDSLIDIKMDPSIAMNSTMNQSSTFDTKSKKTEAIITSFPKFNDTEEYTDVNDYINSNMKFPDEAREMGISGLVKVRFDIYKNGSIGNIDVIQSPDKSFDLEVLRLLDKMPNWKPALSGKNPVESRYQLNINFSLH